MSKIVINIIATNKYVAFLPDLCNSISEYFPDDSELTSIIYTNMDIPQQVLDNKGISFIRSEIKHEPWPASTIKRFEYFINEKSRILESDYCYYIDADSVFIGTLGKEILPENGMVGTIHPCLYNSVGTPERNPHSNAYIPYGSQNRYYCGGFFGGKSIDFINAAEKMKKWIDEDQKKGITAIWHDESHLNRYFYENPPSSILDHPFAIAENLTERKPESRVMFLDKNSTGGHDFYRN
jgi:hypothetical protein